MTQKFIVTTGKADSELNFKFGKVEYHIDLLDKEKEICLGGGMYDTFNGDTLLLYGKSFEFGAPTKDELINALSKIKDFSTFDLLLDITLKKITIHLLYDSVNLTIDELKNMKK